MAEKSINHGRNEIELEPVNDFDSPVRLRTPNKIGLRLEKRKRRTRAAAAAADFELVSKSNIRRQRQDEWV